MTDRRRRARRSVTVRIVAPAGPAGAAAGPPFMTALGEAGIYSAKDDASPADVTLYDLRAAGDDRTGLARQFSAAANAAAGTAALALVTPDQMVLLPPRSGTALPIMMDSPGPRTALASAIRRTALRSDMAEESMVRLKVMSLMGAPDSAPALAAGTLPSVKHGLLIGATAPRLLPLIAALGREIETGAALTRGQALTVLEAAAADRVFLVPDTDRRPQATLLRLLRRHQTLADLPIVVLETEPSDRHRVYWERAGADGVFAEDDLVSATLFADHLAGAQRAEAELRAALGASVEAGDGVLAPISSGRVFEAALLQRSRLATTPFALGAIRLFSDPVAAGSQSLDEAAVYAALGLTEMDLITRPRPDLMILSLPGTDARQAERSIADIVRMITDLKFGPKEAPTVFRAATASVALDPGADAVGALNDLIGRITARPSSLRALA